MQDVNNIPNPDVNSTETEGGYGNRTDIEGENISGEGTEEEIPLPPTEPKPAAIEEPPDVQDQPSIDEPRRNPTQIV
jgi:hypothetical protein